jgi:hypothetical protein
MRRRVLEGIEDATKFSPASFNRAYDALLAGRLWRSGGLLRQKSKIVKKLHLFCVSAASVQNEAVVARAYQLLQAQAVKIVGVGPNIITEILHTHDNRKFAVMNQNSV